MDYPCLLQEWLRSGKRDTQVDNVSRNSSSHAHFQAKDLFDEAAEDIEKHLVQRSAGGLTYIAERKDGTLQHKMDHLACFAAGMYGLAAQEEKDVNSERWLELAQEITNTCHESYVRQGEYDDTGSPGR